MQKFLKILLFSLTIFIFFSLPAPALGQVVINEFSVSPPDKQDWVELFSAEVIDISSWKIADETGDFFTIPEGTSLGPSIYYVISKYQRLNNDKDTIYLYDKDNNLKDSIKYGYEGEVCLPSENGSIARIPDGNSTYDRLLTNTKEQSNGSVVTDPCPIPTPTPTSTQAPTSAPTSTPTATPTPSPTPTKSPTPTPVKTRTATPTATAEETATPESLVLAAVATSEAKGKFPLLSVIFILGGLVCIGGAILGIIKKNEALPENS